ncbi:MAG TPA: anion permease, partial [Thermodesulfobacteriota bacterium]|nr:anion permease [Thermodesulfobacteriota bacterium]
MATEAAASLSTRQRVLSALIPLAVLGIIWITPPPSGLTPQAWKMFAIFAATILGILLQPLPSG